MSNTKYNEYPEAVRKAFTCYVTTPNAMTAKAFSASCGSNGVNQLAFQLAAKHYYEHRPVNERAQYHRAMDQL